MTLLRLSRQAMGTEFQVVLAGEDERHLEQAANLALEEVERLDRQLSLYRPESDLSAINARAAQGPVLVEPGFFRLLERAAEITAATEGAFDVTVGPLMRCWGFFRGQGALPPPAKIAEALGRVGMAHVELDPEERTVRFDRPGIEIDLGAIGKGYAVDRMVALLRESGAESALVHGGYSTICALGRPPEGEAWPLGIRHPFDAERTLVPVPLRDRALSTSGNYEKFFTFEGVVYSHVLDPRTGRPAPGMLSAGALNASATDSDALSTAFFVLGAEKTRAYCRTRPEVAAVLVTAGDRSQETGGRMTADGAADRNVVVVILAPVS